MVVISYKSSSLVLKGMLVDAGEFLEISGNLYPTKYDKVIVLVILLYISKRVKVYYNKD